MFLIRSPDSFSFSCPAPQAPCIVISVLSGHMFLDMASGQFAHSLRTFFGYVWLLLSCLASLVWLGLLSLAWPPRFGLAQRSSQAGCVKPWQAHRIQAGSPELAKLQVWSFSISIAVEKEFNFWGTEIFSDHGRIQNVSNSGQDVPNRGKLRR